MSLRLSVTTRPFALPFEPGQRWALVSDGIQTREGSAVFAKHRSAPARDPADALDEQASRPHDDVGVLLIDVERAS